MEVLVAVVSDDSIVDRIMEAFVQIGVHGATVIDSMGMGQLIPTRIPIFAGLLSALENTGRGSNKTIFSVIDDDRTLRRAVEAIDTAVGGLDNPGTGFAFTVPVGKVFGLTNEA